MKKTRSGQGTLEYVIILAAVVAAIIAVGNNFLKPRLSSTYETLGNKVVDRAGDVKFLD